MFGEGLLRKLLKWSYPRISSKGRRPTRVAIIGSGVAGLAAAKYLLAEREEGTDRKWFEVTIFERHSEVAGIWNLTSTDTDKFQTPMYEGLETNVPRTLMTFSDFPYAKDVPLFPTHDKIKLYLENYAEDIRDHIEFNSEVVMVTKCTKNYQRSQWRVVINNIDSDVAPEYFDAVVVATGTFDKFCMPPEYGLELWEKENPGTVIHAKDFIKPQAFEEKKVLIIGGGPSYFDIGRRMTPYMSSTDHRNVSIPKTLFPKTRSISFIDHPVEKDIDIIMLCTGYQYEFPFLPRVEVTNDGQRVADLWEHMLWIPDITLSFVGLPKMSAIFTVVEAQSAYIARVLVGRLRTPYQSTMQQKTDEKLNNFIAGAVDKKTAAKKFHNLPNPKDKDYINRLSEACIDVDVQAKRGKQPPLFDAYFDWTRKNGGAMRTKFFKQKDKHKFTTPESLGFNYIPDSE